MPSHGFCCVVGKKSQAVTLDPDIRRNVEFRPFWGQFRHTKVSDVKMDLKPRNDVGSTQAMPGGVKVSLEMPGGVSGAVVVRRGQKGSENYTERAECHDGTVGLPFKPNGGRLTLATWTTTGGRWLRGEVNL